jgi:hypothetical protein
MGSAKTSPMVVPTAPISIPPVPLIEFQSPGMITFSTAEKTTL